MDPEAALYRQPLVQSDTLSERQVDDEMLAEHVRLKLSEDTVTADLPIIVHVRDGIVYLHGRVPDRVDSENALNVASRVPGVDDVVDLTDIPAME